MMPELVQELSAGRAVAVTRLFDFQFRSQTVRFWDGLRTLTAGGRDWQGASGIISVSGLEYAEGMGAGRATFGLSGSTPELLAAAVDADQEVKDRPCSVFLQFLSAAYTPLDVPLPVWTGTMDTLSFSGDVGSQSISMSAEGLFVERTRAPNAYYTDSDQRSRWPDDRGMELMPFLKNKSVTWLRS